MLVERFRVQTDTSLLAIGQQRRSDDDPVIQDLLRRYRSNQQQPQQQPQQQRQTDNEPAQQQPPSPEFILPSSSHLRPTLTSGDQEVIDLLAQCEESQFSQFSQLSYVSHSQVAAPPKRVIAGGGLRPPPPKRSPTDIRTAPAATSVVDFQPPSQPPVPRRPPATSSLANVQSLTPSLSQRLQAATGLTVTAQSPLSQMMPSGIPLASGQSSSPDGPPASWEVRAQRLSVGSSVSSPPRWPQTQIDSPPPEEPLPTTKKNTAVAPAIRTPTQISTSVSAPISSDERRSSGSSRPLTQIPATAMATPASQPPPLSFIVDRSAPAADVVPLNEDDPRLSDDPEQRVPYCLGRLKVPHGAGVLPASNEASTKLASLSRSQTEAVMRDLENRIFANDTGRRLLRYMQIFSLRHGLDAD